MASLDIATALVNVRSAISELAAWQTMCGVSTAAEAAQRIVYGSNSVECELPIDQQFPVIILTFKQFSTEWKGNKLHGSVTFELDFSFLMNESEKGSFSDQFLWIWQQLSLMLAALEGAVGKSGEVMIRSLSIPIEPGRFDPDKNTGTSEWTFVIAIGGDFI